MYRIPVELRNRLPTHRRRGMRLSRGADGAATVEFCAAVNLAYN
jgi:hypothetical protein